MRIIYITDARIPTEKAHGYQIMKTCEAFAAAGVAVELTVPQTANPITVDAFAFYGVRPDFLIRYLPVPQLPRSWSFPFSLIPYYASLFFFIRAARQLARTEADTGTVLYTRTGALIPFLSAYAPVVYEVHGFSRLSFIFRFPYATAKHIVAVTHGIRAILEKRGVSAQKITVAPDGVDLSVFEKIGTREECRAVCGVPSFAKVVGYIGRFTVFNREKGIPMLVEAMGFLRKRYPSVKLLLVGGPASSVISYRRRADRCGFGAENILYVPHVPARDVSRFMRACDILTIPLPRSAFSVHYTSPLKMFEYMASGTPFVVSDLPALREIVSENNAFFAEPDSASELTRALSFIFENPHDAERRAHRAAENVQAYTWDARAGRILKSITALLP